MDFRKQLESARNNVAFMRTLFGYIPSYIGKLDDLTDRYMETDGDEGSIEELKPELDSIEKMLTEDQILLTDGGYCLNSKITPQYLDALMYEYGKLQECGYENPLLENAADTIRPLTEDLFARLMSVEKTDEPEIFHAMCTIQRAYDEMHGRMYHQQEEIAVC